MPGVGRNDDKNQPFGKETPKIKEAAPFETEPPWFRQKGSRMSAVPGLGDNGGNTSRRRALLCRYRRRTHPVSWPVRKQSSGQIQAEYFSTPQLCEILLSPPARLIHRRKGSTGHQCLMRSVRPAQPRPASSKTNKNSLDKSDTGTNEKIRTPQSLAFFYRENSQ